VKRKTVIRAKLHLLAAALIATVATSTSFAQEGQGVERTEEALEAYVTSLRNVRNALLIAEDYEAALSPAETVVAELQQAEHPDLINDEVVLASILVELERFDDAESRFLEIVERIEAEEGGFSPELVPPLHLLGRSYIKARMFPEAIAALEQAQFVSQRNEGLFNVGQSGLIDDMTTAYLAMGDTISARDLQIERLRNAQRRFGPNDPQVIPFHNELASYYEQSRLNGKAREQYEAVLEIQESLASAEDGSLLATLEKIASIDLLLDGRERNRERIEEILEQDVDLTPEQRGLALAFLGDWAITDRKRREAEDYYGQAYEILSASEEVEVEEFFADPKLISFSPPLSAVDRGRRRLPYSWGTIVVEFDVSDEGRVAEITGVGATPPDIMEDAYVERLEDAYFRPALIDGKPVESSDIRFTHYFRYYVEDEEEESEE
jgi:hypothetical protein